MYSSFSVAQLVHVELLIIYNFLVKFISGRRFCRLFNEDAKMHYVAEILTQLRK